MDFCSVVVDRKQQASNSQICWIGVANFVACSGLLPVSVCRNLGGPSWIMAGARKRMNDHSHSLASAFEALNPGEAHISLTGGPASMAYGATLFDGEPVIGYGRTREECALDVFTSGVLDEYLEIGQ